MKKILLTLLTILCLSCCFLFVGCGDKGDNTNNDDQIKQVYYTYVAYAESNGETPMSYEDWLASIKGEKGDKGDTGANGQDGKDGKDGVDGATPTIEISTDGFWVINGEKTEVKAVGVDGANGTNGINGQDGVDGKDGQDGVDGATPTIEISTDGFWVINGEKTTTKAIGIDGTNGKDGTNGTNGTNGLDGKDGKDGITPTIEIIDGYWYINGENSGVKAEGKDGVNGTNGKEVISAVIDNNGDLIITFDDNTWINSGNVVAKNPILDENNKISFNNIIIADNKGFIKVENGTTTFSFLDEIEIIGNASYTVSTDIMGLNVIPTKTVNLEIGDNIFYLLESCGNDANLYTITIRRDLHTITFNTNGGTPIEPILVKTGEIIKAPIREGYGLLSDFDFTSCIIKNQNINIEWKAIFCIEGNAITNLTDYGKGLSDIIVPTSIDGVNITKIEDYALDGFGLKTLMIPDSVISISDYALGAVTRIEEATIPAWASACVTVGYGLDRTQSLKRLRIISGDIKNSAFGGCDSLETLIIDDNVGNIGNYAFYNCSSLKYVEIGKGVERIGENAFAKCALVSLSVPDNVKEIDNFAFSECFSLNTLKLSNKLQSLGACVFSGCTGLKEVIIPESVESVGNNIFAGADSVVVYCLSKSQPIGWSDIWNYTNCPTYWYSEKEPIAEGNYWHYVDGVPTAWVKD